MQFDLRVVDVPFWMLILDPHQRDIERQSGTLIDGGGTRSYSSGGLACDTDHDFVDPEPRRRALRMTFCVYHRFKVLAVQLVPTFVCDIRIATRYLPILYAHERGAGTARRPKPNAVISFSQVGPLLLDTTLAEYHCKKFNAEIGS